MTLDTRIKTQFPVLIVTLLSVLIGLDFADLVGNMRARMVLWPLDIETVRIWGQIVTVGCCALSVWIIFAHLAISRSRIPTLADSVVVFLAPLMLLFANSLVGQKESWPWFYFASAYLFVSLVAWQWQIRIAAADNELASLARLTHPLGPLSIVYVGIPFYATAGWADSHGLFSLLIEALITLTSGPAAILTAWLFLREWRSAVAQAEAADLEPLAVAAD